MWRWLGLVWVVGCTGEVPVAEPEAPVVRWSEEDRTAALAEGRAVLEEHQCNRCHVIDDLGKAARELHCTGCHNFLDGLRPEDELYQRLTAKYGTLIDRYQKNIVHLKTVPNLTEHGKRVRPDFVASYLAAPFDLRPVMTESMFRHALDEGEIRAISRYFAAVADVPDPTDARYVPPEPPPRPSDAVMARGEELFVKRGCTACHQVGNLDLGPQIPPTTEAAAATLLGPNLRFARERMDPETAIEWILNPMAVQSHTLMPKMVSDRAEAIVLRDWLWHVDPKVTTVAPSLELKTPTLLEREVSYAEVKEEVLGYVCVHCHMNDYERDPGPGNLGGLGYAGVGLSMRTYETLVQGSRAEDGSRYSVLEPREEGGLPLLIEVMLMRQVEGLRDQVAAGDDHARPEYPEGPLGMPMGLPALSDAQIALTATWIAQGCRGPTEVSGIPGADDGFPVPDGPIGVNEGCQQRDPATERPAWAVDAKTPGVVEPEK